MWSTKCYLWLELHDINAGLPGTCPLLTECERTGPGENRRVSVIYTNGCANMSIADTDTGRNNQRQHFSRHSTRNKKPITVIHSKVRPRYF